MPHDFPPWSTVYDYYSRWVKTGVWEKINRQLLKLVRKGAGRKKSIIIFKDPDSKKRVYQQRLIINQEENFQINLPGLPELNISNLSIWS